MDWYKGVSSLVLFLIINGVFITSQQCPQLTLKNGRVRTRNRGQMATFACSPGFVRVGSRYSSCLGTGAWSAKVPTCVGTACPPFPSIPNMQVESLHRGGVIKFSCEPGYYRQGPEEVQCEGRRWASSGPTCIEGVSLGCDFEQEGMCGWSQDSTDNFDWTWHQGHTPTSDTGPSADHTTKTADGHYIYIESSSPTKNGYKARLLSPQYKPADVANQCLQFYYHMKGPTGTGEIGHLDVYLQPASIPPSNTLNPTHNFFSNKVAKDDLWHKVDQPIPAQTEPMRIIFQGTRLKSWHSDIAIDDIKLYSCPQEGNATTTSAPASTTQAPPAAVTTARPTAAVTDVVPAVRGGQTTTRIESVTSSPTTVASRTNVPAGATTGRPATGHSTGRPGTGTGPVHPPTHETGDGRQDGGSRPGTRSDTDSGPRTRITTRLVNADTHRAEQEAGGAKVAAASTSGKILPIVIGVSIAFIVAIVLVAVIIWAVNKRKQRRESEIDDEMRIISKGSQK